MNFRDMDYGTLVVFFFPLNPSFEGFLLRTSFRELPGVAAAGAGCVHLCVDAIKSYRLVCQVCFFRDEKCYLIMLFAVLSAEDLLLLPDAAGMFAAGYSDLIFFFFKLDCKAISETSGKFPSI